MLKSISTLHSLQHLVQRNSTPICRGRDYFHMFPTRFAFFNCLKSLSRKKEREFLRDQKGKKHIFWMWRRFQSNYLEHVPSKLRHKSHKITRYWEVEISFKILICLIVFVEKQNKIVFYYFCFLFSRKTLVSISS